MIWTDVFQMVIMLAGFIAVIARGAVLQGGFGKIWEDNFNGGRLDTFRYVIALRSVINCILHNEGCYVVSMFGWKSCYVTDMSKCS